MPFGYFAIAKDASPIMVNVSLTVPQIVRKSKQYLLPAMQMRGRGKNSLDSQF